MTTKRNKNRNRFFMSRVYRVATDSSSKPLHFAAFDHSTRRTLADGESAHLPTAREGKAIHPVAKANEASDTGYQSRVLMAGMVCRWRRRFSSALFASFSRISLMILSASFWDSDSSVCAFFSSRSSGCPDDSVSSTEDGSCSLFSVSRSWFRFCCEESCCC